MAMTDPVILAIAIRNAMLTMVVGPGVKTLGDITTPAQQAAMLESWKKFAVAHILYLQEHATVNVTTTIATGNASVDPTTHVNIVPITGTGTGTLL